MLNCVAFKNRHGERVSEAGSVSLSLFHSTPRFAIHLITLAFVPVRREGEPPFIVAIAASGRKIEAGGVQGTMEGPSHTYMTGMYVLKTKEGESEP